MSDQGFWYFVLNPCKATTLSHLDTGWKYMKQNYAFIMNNIDKKLDWNCCYGQYLHIDIYSG